MSDTPLFDRPADRVVEALSLRIAEAFAEVVRHDDEGADLAGAVTHHLAHLEAAMSHNEFLDIDLARKLARQCRRLLDWANGADLADDQRALARAAVRYFVLDDDGDSDADSILGLEDDEEVLVAVARELGCVEVLGA